MHSLHLGLVCHECFGPITNWGSWANFILIPPTWIFVEGRVTYFTYRINPSMLYVYLFKLSLIIFVVKCRSIYRSSHWSHGLQVPLHFSIGWSRAEVQGSLPWLRRISVAFQGWSRLPCVSNESKTPKTGGGSKNPSFYFATNKDDDEKN